MIPLDTAPVFYAIRTIDIQSKATPKPAWPLMDWNVGLRHYPSLHKTRSQHLWRVKPPPSELGHPMWVECTCSVRVVDAVVAGVPTK